MMTINFVNEMQFWDNAYIFLPLIYMFIGYSVVSYINRQADSIIDMLSEAGIGAKGQGIAYVFLTLTWPIWAFIAMQCAFNNYLNRDEK